MSQSELRIRMLGDFQLGWANGRSVEFPETKLSPKNRAILCFLVLNHRPHRREELANNFWPDKDYVSGLANLRVALTALRAANLAPYLEATREDIMFLQHAGCWCDVFTFETVITQNRFRREPDIPSLQKAVELYRGEFLDGFSLPEVPFFAGWVESQRRHFEDLAWLYLETLIKWAIKDPVRFKIGIQYAYRAVEIIPWSEAAHEYLMWLLASTGQQTVALLQYERCREAMLKYFDSEPTVKVQNLARKIRHHQLPVKVAPKPLPPLPNDELANKPPFLAPETAPYFVGRAEPMAELTQALTSESGLRRLGIVGLGGIGKTTLALHLAHMLRDDFPDGVLWANVADEQPEEIATRWAAAYGHDFSQQKSSVERLAAVRRLLAGKRALLIFDDVWAGARIRHLLPESGQCAVLITSRFERIVQNVDAVSVQLVQFLPENGRQLLQHYVKARVMAEPDVADEICRLVGNLPLAINIAGSYLAYRPHRSLAAFIDQLKDHMKPLDLAEDDQLIRETFELSWKHLDETPSRIFALLGLFAGRTFSLDAVANIYRMDPYLMEDKLEELVTLSLLSKQDDSRYRQHSLLATFAKEKLTDDGALLGRYITYFAKFSSQFATEYAVLSPEWGNLDAAIKYAEETQQWEMVLQFTAVLKDAWFARGRFQQAREAFETAFQAAIRLEDEPLLAQNWLWWGKACLEQGDQEEARKWLQQALDLYDELEDGIGIANAEFELARIDIDQALLAEAEQRLKRVLTLRQAQKDEQGVAATLTSFAKLRHRHGDNDAAKTFALDAASKQQAIGDQQGRCKTLRFLVFIMIALEQLELAYHYGKEALIIAEELNDLGEIAVAKFGIATALRRLGRLEEANQMAEESYTSLSQMGDTRSMIAVRFLQCLIRKSEENYEEAFVLAEECLAEFTRFEDDLHIAYCLIHLGDFYKIFGERAAAVQKWQVASQIVQQLGNEYLVGKISERLASKT